MPLPLPVAIAVLCLLLPVRLSLAAEPAPRFALLVGVSEYPKLSEAEQLEGSHNDVVLMKQMLMTRFGFDAEQIVMLTGQAATGAADFERLSMRSQTRCQSCPMIRRKLRWSFISAVTGLNSRTRSAATATNPTVWMKRWFL